MCKPTAFNKSIVTLLQTHQLAYPPYYLHTLQNVTKATARIIDGLHIIPNYQQLLFSEKYSYIRFHE